MEKRPGSAQPSGFVVGSFRDVWKARPMGVVLSSVWGGGLRGKKGVGDVFKAVESRSTAIPDPTGPEDPSVDLYFFFSGNLWQHER